MSAPTGSVSSTAASLAREPARTAGSGVPTPESRLGSVAVKLGLAWLYAVGLAQVILQLNGLPRQIWLQAAAMAALLVVLALLTWGRYQLLAVLSLVGLTSGILYLTRKRWLPPAGFDSLLDPVRSWLSWAGNHLLGYTNAGDEQVAGLALVICLATALLAYIWLARFNWPAAAIIAPCVILFLAQSLPPAKVIPWLLLSAWIALAALARKQKKTYRYQRKQKTVLQARLLLQALPVAAVTLSLALVLTPLVPVDRIHSRSLEALVDDLLSLWQGVRWEDQNLPGFSLQPAGFYPLTERLGGPAYLSDVPVLRVSGTAGDLLLRGSVSQIYDGQSWQQDPDRSFYRFDSPLWLTEQQEVFDLDRPDLRATGLSESQISRTETVRWASLGLPNRIIFIHGRPLAIGLLDTSPFQVYFRPSGQLFNKHWLQPGQTVEVRARVLRTEQADFAAWVRQIQAGLSEEARILPAPVTEAYLQLPDSADYQPGGFLFERVAQIVASTADPYERVRLIRQHLQLTCSYNLMVSVPPADVDFVTWFLQTREGYCVYFATAQTMLSRLAGVPARYVEGYYAPGTGNSSQIRVLTGEQAHAWSEVYLAGIGWVTVDATPGGALTQPDPTPAVTATPTPGATPTPTLPAQVTPTGAIDQPDATPTPRPDPTPLDWSALPSPWYLLVLLVLPFAWLALALRRLRLSHRSEHVRAVYPEPRRQVLFYWRQIKLLLGGLSVNRQGGETPGAYLRRQLAADAWLSGRDEAIEQIASTLEQVLYSQEEPAAEAVVPLAELYDQLEETARQNKSPLSYWPWRLWHGGGVS
jgi:transglutaminase-like putative cysteine protease